MALRCWIPREWKWKGGTKKYLTGAAEGNISREGYGYTEYAVHRRLAFPAMIGLKCYSNSAELVTAMQEESRSDVTLEDRYQLRWC
jgi:hypothetical protein